MTDDIFFFKLPKGQGVTKKGQGAAPCKNGLGRTPRGVAYMRLQPNAELPTATISA